MANELSNQFALLRIVSLGFCDVINADGHLIEDEVWTRVNFFLGSQTKAKLPPKKKK